MHPPTRAGRCDSIPTEAELDRRMVIHLILTHNYFRGISAKIAATKELPRVTGGKRDDTLEVAAVVSSPHTGAGRPIASHRTL